MVDLNLEALMYVTKAALPHPVEAVATSPRKVAVNEIVVRPTDQV